MPYTDPEARRAYNKAYHSATKERRAPIIAASQKAWYEANKEHANATSKAWYEANKEGRAVTIKAWQEANKEHHKALVKNWYEANKEHYITTQRERDRTSRPERYRKAYDPNCRPFPATYDPVVGEWVRCERTLLPAPDTTLAVRVAAAIIMIEEALAA